MMSDQNPVGVVLPQAIVTRLLVETFLYEEAALLDAWDLDGWLELFTQDCAYEVTPPGVDNPESISRTEVYFLIGDDRHRLEHRIKRLKRPNAHVETPRSKVRHLYTNVIIQDDDGEKLTVYANFLTFRTKRGTFQYMGRTRYILHRNDGGFLIASKRVMLDLDNLVPQGRVSIIL